MEIPKSSGPHGQSEIVVAGNTDNPSRALILLHGRGASAENIIQLTDQLTLSDDYIIIAPQAVDHSWYPQRFIVPTEDNQPYLDSALERIYTIISELNGQFNINTSSITLAGFSQGACLVAEYLKRYPARYQGAAIYSGGLIGSDDEASAAYAGESEQTPIYLGCDEADFHIPKERVERSAEIFIDHDASVTCRLYKNLGHTIHPEGIAFLNKVIDEGASLSQPQNNI